MNHFFSLHTYWLLNAAIAISYLFAQLFRFMLSNQLSQAQLLKSVRCIFIMTLAILLLIPVVLEWFPSVKSSNFQLQPILKQASFQFLQNHETVKAKMDVIQSVSALPSMQIICLVLMLAGSCFFLGKYIHSIIVLKKIVRNAYCDRVVKKVQILFSHQTSVPFCWSGFNAYVVLPADLLEKSEDLRFIVRHELQHIRQGDTYWLHFNAVIKIACFWNPCLILWNHLFAELQEFACDEALILRKNTSPVDYAQCLIDTAANLNANNQIPCHTLGILGLSKHFHVTTLKRRVTMLFSYQLFKTKKLSILSAYAACFMAASSMAYALNNAATSEPLTAEEVTAIIEQSNSPNVLHLKAEPEVVLEINRIRGSEQASSYMRAALGRMQQYKPMIKAQLNNHGLPKELLAIPLVESGYKPLEPSKNIVQAAGLWQIIPSTGKWLGLVINKNRDDRMDATLSTKAAIKYLALVHSQFQDWKLAAIAYEIGEDRTAELIKTVGTRDAWKLARSSVAPKSLSRFLALLDASVIIMQNPSLIS